MKSRLLEYLITFLVIITINFALPRMMPGDPFLQLYSAGGETGVSYTEEQREYFVSYYGLDRPAGIQYFSYLGGLLKGDLGFSYYFKDSVASMIFHRLPWTLLLITAATGLSLVAGILLGSFAAWRRGQRSEQALYLFMVTISEIPAFLVGLVLLVLLAAGAGLFPLSGAITHFSRFNTTWAQILDILHHAALPVLTLAIARAGGFFLLVRNSLGTVLTRDYMRTARAKGLSERRIRYRHALRNALLPLVTRTAMQMGAIVGGAVLVENVFAYPGLGRLMYEAVFVRDYPLLQGIFLVLAVAVLAANLLADILYRKLDPRIVSAFKTTDRPAVKDRPGS